MSSSTNNDNNSPKKEEAFSFQVGVAARRELRRALKQGAANPQQTIQSFQESHSLHYMFSKAFGTMSIPEAQKEKATRSKLEKKTTVESLDSDSVMTFLSHLGVSQYEVHRRISDTLLKQLEDEIRKTSKSEGKEQQLLFLLQESWSYAVRLPELRPIVW